MGSKELKEKLPVGTRIKIGEQYAREIGGLNAGEIITLVEGTFEYDNGLYIQYQTAPSVWNEEDEEFDSIFHLFGNNLENFMDCEILTQTTK